MYSEISRRTVITGLLSFPIIGASSDTVAAQEEVCWYWKVTDDQVEALITLLREDFTDIELSDDADPDLISILQNIKYGTSDMNYIYGKPDDEDPFGYYHNGSGERAVSSGFVLALYEIQSRIRESTREYQRYFTDFKNTKENCQNPYQINTPTPPSTRTSTPTATPISSTTTVKQQTPTRTQSETTTSVSA
jgi:hypothetical protein